MSKQTEKTRRLVLVAILSALSFVLMYFSFPLIPGADFLKIELSVIPALLGLLIMDIKGAYLILLLRTVLKLLLKNGGVNDFIGLPMNLVALGLFIAIFALLWKKTKTTVRFILAGVLATLGLTIAMIVLNYSYAVPMYATFANFDISQILGLNNYLFKMVLPFNVIQGLIFTLIFGVVYSAMKSHLNKL